MCTFKAHFIQKLLAGHACIRSAVTMWEGERFYLPVAFTFPHSPFRMMTHKRKKPLKLREISSHHQELRVCSFVSLLRSVLFPLIPSAAAEGLPRWAEGGHRHAPEQRAAGAAALRVGQQGLPALPLPHHQDLLLGSWGVPHPPRRRPPGHLLCLLRLHGSAEGQHRAGHSG